MLLEGKKALIFGVANKKSIAYGIAQQLKDQGCSLAFSYVNDAIKKRVDPISEELGGEFTFECDVASDESIAQCAELTKEKWGNFDILIHSVAFADRADLKGRFIDTSRDGFKLALDISAFSLIGLCQKFEPLMNDNGSVITLTYLGANRVLPHYNVMGVAKAALESSVRYLSPNLGERGIRVNAISAGPIKTLAASGISDFRKILNHVEENAPLQRNVTTEDVGKAALYLASDLASGVTGEVMYVDSGYNNMAI
ncbi:MAG: enoyl-ACP reductase FabI [Desulfovibrio sp.]